VAAVIGVVAVLTVAGGLAYKFLLTGNSDEDQIKALVQNVTAHENNADGPGLLPLLCTYDRGHNPSTSQILRKEVDQYGTATTSVTDIHITGDQATATVTTIRSNMPGETYPHNRSFAKENGSWQYCGDSND
jgi:hypothetical protein